MWGVDTALTRDRFLCGFLAGLRRQVVVVLLFLEPGVPKYQHLSCNVVVRGTFSRRLASLAACFSVCIAVREFYC